MGINKEKYLHFIKEKEAFDKFKDREYIFTNRIKKNIIKYIKCLYPQIKYFREDMIVDINYDKHIILFSVDSFFRYKISYILGADYKNFKMPIKYLNNAELENLKIQRKLELL